jgi:hypothetical protein
MTTKLPSGLAASGPADETDSEQITKEHSEEIEDIVVDPSDDVTVEATEDVTSQAVAGTPPPSLRRTPEPIVGDSGTPAPRLSTQTLLGVPIQSLPLPGVTAVSSSSRNEFLDEHEEVTAMAPSVVDELLARGPSITDDDEEETKVEPADAAIKAAASGEDVSTALSAQASVEREKALRRSAAPAMAPTSSDLEFEDPNGDDDDDDGEVLSASAADEIEDDDDAVGGDDGDDDEGAAEDVATGTFAKPVDSTGFSGLLNARRSPPMGSPFGRDGFGSARLPTPSPGFAAAISTAPAPATSPFSARLSPVPAGSPYGARATSSSMPAIQIPAPSAAPSTTAGTGLFSRVQVPAYVLAASAIAFFGLGFGTRAMVAPSRPAQTIVVTKQVPAPPVAPAVDPVPPPLPGGTTPAAAHAGGAEVSAPKTAVVEPTPTIEPEPPRPVKKVVAVKRKPADDTLAEEAALKPKLTASVSKPAAPVPAVKAAPAPAAPKPAKKPTKVWVDPFAQ